MSDMTLAYCDLRIEDGWIDYLRTRLPYSFNHIEEMRDGPSRSYVVSEPVLLTGAFAAERHNFWRRGNVYYMSGKILDYYNMPEVGRSYRTLVVRQLLTDAGIDPIIWPLKPIAFYNSMQMEKVWGFAQDNHLDRERVAMTNVVLAVELCLKAVSTHANFRESGSFMFNAGHDVSKLYGALPESLREEVTLESEVFAGQYLSFRASLEARINRMLRPQPQTNPNRKGLTEAEWNELARNIREGTYTAFVNSNDPGMDEKYLHEGWFEEALSQVKLIEEPGDITQYFRYAPHEDKDELPPDLIHWILLLGRFLYEHLFPVPGPDNGPHSGFPIRS